jgi:dTDP-4-dehydrorhamnose reductase
MLITGGHGKLGTALRREFPDALAPGREEMDITNIGQVESFFEKNRPKTIIHLAAATNVREAEKNKQDTFDINVKGTENLVNAALKFTPDAHFIYMSTACVFYGDRGNYSEEDIPQPKNYYALTKLLGEYVAKRVTKHLIIRSNFVAREPWPFPKAFTDRFGTYLFADDLAKGIKDVMVKKMAGLVHVAGDKRMSMYELAKLTGSEVGEMTMDGIDLPLTKDMTLVSVRIPPYKIS